MQLPPWIRNVGIALAVVWLGHRLLVDVLIDWLWFDAVGYASVFKTSLTAEVLCWAGGFITAVIALGFNLRVAIQRAPLNLMGLGILMQQASLPADRIRGIVRLGIGAAIALPAFMIAGGAGQPWLDVLALLHRQSFGVVERPPRAQSGGTSPCTLSKSSGRPTSDHASINGKRATTRPCALNELINSTMSHGSPAGISRATLGSNA